jgi:hypothetical protein
VTQPPRRTRRHRIPSGGEPRGRYWTDLRFRHTASDALAADAAVAQLVEEAERLGFDLELARTRPHAPSEPLPD